MEEIGHSFLKRKAVFDAMWECIKIKQKEVCEECLIFSNCIKIQQLTENMRAFKKCDDHEK